MGSVSVWVLNKQVYVELSWREAVSLLLHLRSLLNGALSCRQTWSWLDQAAGLRVQSESTFNQNRLIFNNNCSPASVTGPATGPSFWSITLISSLHKNLKESVSSCLLVQSWCLMSLCLVDRRHVLFLWDRVDCLHRSVWSWSNSTQCFTVTD